jgi:hypothetical protein
MSPARPGRAPAAPRWGRAVGGVLLSLGLLAGCSLPGSGGTTTTKEAPVPAEDAKRRVIALVQDAMSAARPGTPAGAGTLQQRSSCKDALGAPTDEVQFEYVYRLPVQAQEVQAIPDRVEQAWRAKGYQATRERDRLGNLLIYSGVDGYNLRLLLNADAKRLVLGGSSPCVPSG